jgi:hypothetical protein
VLQNDTDADGDVLTAVLVGGPSRGAVDLNSDGSFSYSPNAGITGTDSFTYKASDGKAESNTTTVTITVSAAPAADTVIVTSATWTLKNRNLVVQATSTAQPDATLTVQDYGVMSWNGAFYTFTKKMSSAPTGVTVTSNRGGSDTKTVTVK